MSLVNKTADPVRRAGRRGRQSPRRSAAKNSVILLWGRNQMDERNWSGNVAEKNDLRHGGIDMEQF
jgi:hypothetical protein